MRLKERLVDVEAMDPEGVARDAGNMRKKLQDASHRADAAESELEGVGRDRARVTMQLRRAEEEVSKAETSVRNVAL